MPPEQNDTPAPGSGAEGRPGMKGENGLPSWAVWILVGVVALAVISALSLSAKPTDPIPFSEFTEQVEEGNIAKVTWIEHASVASWNYNDDLRIKGTFALLGANEFAAFCVTVAAVLFALLLATKASWKWRVLFAGGIACMVLGVLYAYSRTAYFALLLALVTVVLAWRGRWKMMLPLLLAAAILPAALPPSVVQRFDSSSVEEGSRDESTEMRFEFWAIAWKNFVAHPVVGTGFQSFRHPEINPYKMDTHNVYLRTLSEGGEEGPCGWLKDKFGLSWQVVPSIVPALMAGGDAKADRVMGAIMTMKKIDVDALKQAADV